MKLLSLIRPAALGLLSPRLMVAERENLRVATQLIEVT